MYTHVRFRFLFRRHGVINKSPPHSHAAPLRPIIYRSPATAAFDFFDSKSKGRITLPDLRSRLTVFYKSLQPREFKFLMNNQPELSFEALYAMLAENELTNFDPVAEAFKVYDPMETGFVNMEVLVDIFSHLGFGTLTEDDVRVLLETGDVDKDGRISLDDFRRMLDVKCVEYVWIS